MSLADKLDKIRSPKLQNQRETAVVLSAVEETLKSQSYDPTPTAYFAALLALLSQSVSPQNGVVNKELATSVVYLLDLVTSYVPASLLRPKFEQILTSLAPVLTNADLEAPLIRSSIGCLESLLVAQDGAAWALPQTQISPRRAISGLLHLAQDHRPKVRKRAQEAITNVLQSPPPSPSLDHPAADMCAETALRGVTETLSTKAVDGKKSRKDKGRQGDEHQPSIQHALHLVKTIATASNGWPSKKIEPLCEILMRSSRSNDWLAMTAFEIFEAIFQGMAGEIASSKLPKLMEVIMDMKPASGDERLVPSWCAVISRGYDVSAQIEPQETFQKLPKVFESVMEFCASRSHNVRISASECLVSFLVNCVPDDVILEPSVYDEKAMEGLARLVLDLLSVKYQSAWMEIFTVLSATLSAFRWRADGLLDDTVKAVGDLRENEAFNGKKEADEVIGRAIEAMGAAKVLEILPLNLVKPAAGQRGRAWLLPILRDHVQNTRLGHFRSLLVPISEMMFQKVLDQGSSEKTMETKIFETLVQQIWATLPGYCTVPIDVLQSFDQPFAEMLASLLYSQTNLRTDICNGLQALVESHKIVAASEATEKELQISHRISKSDAQKALDHMASFAGNLLAVLFNVYSQTLPQYRGYILQCINAYLSIIPEKEILEIFERVTTMLEAALKETSSQTQGDKQQQQPKKQPSTDSMPPTSHTLMDLIITISIYLPRSSFPPLFSLAALVLPQQSDPQLQKKAYKLLPRLSISPMGLSALKGRNSELQSLLLDTASSVSAPSRRDRLAAIATAVEYLPPTDLHFIPSVLSEVVLACKEVNEKARTQAFDLLVLMANRMASGGEIQQSKIPHMEDPAAPTTQANIEEFFTMVSAGLAGNTPHMISASITALTRILYEFAAQLPEPVLEDLVQTLSLFLTSTNREIVRSVLGFVKVAIISLPEPLVKPRLESLIPGLMSWSREHKARFRAKVKHILERIIRRFGYEVVEKYCPEGDRKLVANIRKTRERRKKKGKQADEEADDGSSDDDDEPRKRSFESSYDQALYGSDSSASASGSDADFSDDGAASGGNHRKARKGSSTYITESLSEPLDLLDRRSLANISTRRPLVAGSHNKPPTKRKSEVDVDGKLVFREPKNDGKVDGGDDGMILDSAAQNGKEAGEGEGGGEGGVDAYVSAISGRDAVQRGRGGRLKFNTKREKNRGADGDGGGGEEMDIDNADDVDGKGAGKKVRFADGRGVNGRLDRSGRGGRGDRGGGVSFKAGGRGGGRGGGGGGGGISKRVERRSLGGGKVRGARVGKAGGRR